MSTDCHLTCDESACANGVCQDDGTLRVEAPPAVPLAEALRLWGSEARFGVCDTGRYRASYFVWGHGPPLVFIHGLADLAKSFVLMMEPLRRHFTCVGYELPDGGGDGARLGAYRHRHLVADLFALLDHLGFARSYLFGSSFGSTIALAALAEAPQRLPRAVLQGGFACRGLARWEHFLCSFARYWRGPMRTFPLRGRLDYPADVRSFARVPSEHWTFLKSNTGAVSKAATARRGLMVPRIDLRPLLPKILQPVLLVCGEEDYIVPRVCEAPLMDGLPKVERVEFPSCGHYPQYTHAPVLAEVVRRFLTPPSSSL
jgi:pimeloyl-ACP methyl ester carboxylesterase